MFVYQTKLKESTETTAKDVEALVVTFDNGTLPLEVNPITDTTSKKNVVVWEDSTGTVFAKIGKKVISGAAQ